MGAAGLGSVREIRFRKWSLRKGTEGWWAAQGRMCVLLRKWYQHHHYYYYIIIIIIIIYVCV